jgi:RNA methyltransferase, TrmH family
MRAGYVVDLVRSSRRDPARVRLEGIHALKHALRFGAEIEAVVSPDVTTMRRLLAELAPDVELPVEPIEVDPATWGTLTERDLPSPALSVARRPTWTPAEVVAAPGRVVVLEAPRHLGNVGAAIRVAAAADAGGMLVVGDADPWHPTAVRGAAGLQFAIRVARAEQLPATPRPVMGLDPEGIPLGPGVLAADAVVLFGTERGGLSPTLRARATELVGIPMRSGVSSLNLATAVAVALYAGR